MRIELMNEASHFEIGEAERACLEAVLEMSRVAGELSEAAGLVELADGGDWVVCPRSGGAVSVAEEAASHRLRAILHAVAAAEWARVAPMWIGLKRPI